MSHLKDNRRHNVITASNAYAAVYERQKLWRQMTLREPPFAGNEMTEYGVIHEPIALSALEKEFEGIKTIKQLMEHMHAKKALKRLDKKGTVIATIPRYKILKLC